MHNDNHDTMLSRTGNTQPGGKLSRRLDILVTEELEAALITMAGIKGMPKGECARKILERVMFGEFPMMQRIFAQSTSTPDVNHGSNAR